MPIFYAHRNQGQAVFVKTSAEFKSLNGHKLPWGKGWKRLVARNVKCARGLAEQRLPRHVAPVSELSGLDMIRDERLRQIHIEGYTAAHDNTHVMGELCFAAACYASPAPIYINLPNGALEDRRFIDPWPWKGSYDKRNNHGRLRQLAIAGALIAAEIDRLVRGGATE